MISLPMIFKNAQMFFLIKLCDCEKESNRFTDNLTDNLTVTDLQHACNIFWHLASICCPGNAFIFPFFLKLLLQLEFYAFKAFRSNAAL